MLCPCHSQKKYRECCEPFHSREKLPETAVELMRSRYSAYAQHKAEYIMDTTHPQNSSYSTNKERWKQEILKFSKETRFSDLKIISFSEQGKTAYVTFIATLFQNGKNVSFREKSFFIKENGSWLYHSGTFN